MIESTEGSHPRPPSDQLHCGAQTLINLRSAKWVTAATSSWASVPWEARWPVRRQAWRGGISLDAAAGNTNMYERKSTVRYVQAISGTEAPRAGRATVGAQRA